MSKGIALTLSEYLAGLLAVSFAVFILFLWYGKYFDIETTVTQTEFERKEINLAQVLLTTDKLTYVDDNKVVHRAVFDKSKLDSIEQNPKPLFDEIGYPDSEYYLKIRDLVSNKEWNMGKENDVLRSFPVSIRYSFDDVHSGVMYVALSGRNLV